MSNMFAGLKNAKVTERGVFMKPGLYKVRVVKAIMKNVRKGGHNAFILEFKVEQSNYDQVREQMTKGLTLNVEQLEELERKLPNKVGTSASWFQSLQDLDVGFGALKSFAAAITGSKHDDPEFVEAVESILTEAVNGDAEEQKKAAREGRPPEGSLNGCLLPLETFIIKTKPKPNFPEGTDFTVYRFGKIIDETPAAN